MQAERDSLAGLSEVLTSRAPSLVPNAAGGYDEPGHASEPQPQAPGLTQLRRKLGLPLQRPVHQAAAAPVQRTDDGSAAQQGAEHPAAVVSEPEVQRLVSCSYEVCEMGTVQCVGLELHLQCLRSLFQFEMAQEAKSKAGLASMLRTTEGYDTANNQINPFLSCRICMHAIIQCHAWKKSPSQGHGCSHGL